MAITVVQSPAGVSGNATTLSVTISAPGSTNQLIALVASDQVNASISMSALTSQVWVKSGFQDGGATQCDYAVFLTSNPGTGTTVTMSNSGTAKACGMFVIEIAGGANSTTNDGYSTSTVSSGSTTAYTCASRTPAVAGDILVSMACNDSVNPTWTLPTSPSGWTGLATVGSGPNYRAAYNILTGTPACAANWVSSISDVNGFSQQMLVQAPSAAAATPTFQPTRMPLGV